MRHDPSTLNTFWPGGRYGLSPVDGSGVRVVTEIPSEVTNGSVTGLPVVALPYGRHSSRYR